MAGIHINLSTRLMKLVITNPFSTLEIWIQEMILPVKHGRASICIQCGATLL